MEAGKRLMIGRKEPGNGVCLTTDLKSNYQITVGVGHKPALIEAINDTKDVLREGDIDSFNLIFDRKRSDSFQEQVSKMKKKLCLHHDQQTDAIVLHLR